MDWFSDNWPLVISCLAVGFLVIGVIKKLIWLVVMAAIVVAVGLYIWPRVKDEVTDTVKNQVEQVSDKVTGEIGDKLDLN